MIRKILTYYASRLDEYLSRTHRQPEGVATVMIGGRPAARMGDTTAHGGTIAAGCPTVMIGG